MQAENPLWSFVVVADPHLAENPPFSVPRGLEGVSAEAKFRRALRKIEALQPRPRFMLLPGDLGMQPFEAILPEISLPLHVVAGNHERKADRQRLRELFPDDFQGRDFYSFQHEDCLFIGLCNVAPLDHVGHFESQHITPNIGQMEWLEQELKRGRDCRHCVVFGHVPPTPDGSGHEHHLSQNDADWLRRQVRAHRPTAMFFGHRHQRIWFHIGPTPVYALRSCSWNFDPDEPVGFVHVHVFADRLDVRFISLLD